MSHDHDGHDHGHGHEHEHEHEEPGDDQGHFEDGHEERGDGSGEGHGSHDDGHGNGHGERGHFEEEEEEPLIEPAGIINDLKWGDETARTVDLSEFFPISNVLAVKHNDRNVFNDFKKGKAAPLSFAKRRALRIAKLKSRRFSDILNRKDCAPGLLSYVDRSRVVRPNPLAISIPVDVPEGGIDVRPMEPVAKTVTHPDIMYVPPTFGKRLRRIARRHGKTVAKTAAVAAAVGTVLAGAAYWTIGAVEREVEGAYADLLALRETAATVDAGTFFVKTEDLERRFSQVEWLLAPVRTVLDSPVYSQKQVRLAGNVVRGGRHLSGAAKEIASVWKAFSEVPAASADPASAFASGSAFKFTDFVREQLPKLERADRKLSAALAEYSQVGSLGNPDLDAKFSEAVSKLISAQGHLKSVLEKTDPVLRALGDKSPQRYLVFNQNRDELRATGGFPGSAVFLEFYKGRLEKYEKRDIYYYDWHLFPLAPKAPPGLDRVSEKWGIRDANYYPELDRNFAVIDDFYQKSGGSSLNGVVFLNQSLVTDFLEKYGGVNVPSVGKTLDASNFGILMSVLVENRVAASDSPKDVLFEFVSNLEAALKARGDYSGYLATFLAQAESGEILAYSSDADVNAFFREIFPGERVRNLRGNFVYPVFTSISGNKSDRYVHRTFRLSSKPFGSGSTDGTGCSVLNRFLIESDHRMTTDDKEGIRKLLFELGVPPEKHEQQIAIQGNGENRQYVRVLVPKGSKLFGTPPMQTEVDDSRPEYTTVSFYATTDVGKTSAAFFDYETPLSDCSDTKPAFVKQPGLANYQIQTE